MAIRDNQEAIRRDKSGLKSKEEHLAKLQAEYAALKVKS
jgi:hypothetical protein